MVAAPNEPPDTPEMAKMRRAGAIALSFASGSSFARSMSSPTAVAAAKAARLAPPSAATITAGGQTRAAMSQLAAFHLSTASAMSICRRLKSSAALGRVRTSLKCTLNPVTHKAATTATASHGKQYLCASQARNVPRKTKPPIISGTEAARGAMSAGKKGFATEATNRTVTTAI